MDYDNNDDDDSDDDDVKPTNVVQQSQGVQSSFR